MDYISSGKVPVAELKQECAIRGLDIKGMRDLIAQLQAYIDDGNIGGGFKLFYYGVDRKGNGVGVILKEEYSKSVVKVKRVSDRVLIVKVEVEGMMINVISAYAPQVSCEMAEKERFWSELDKVVDGVPRNEQLVIGADLNGHVGNRGDEEVM
ncbi:hypothetical protein C0J45_24457, partial [Silurus meridionalis]